MSRKHTQIAVSLAAGFILLAGLLALAVMQAPPIASADTVPTPVAVMNQSDSAALVTFVDSISSTDGADAPSIQVYTFEYCNLQYILDHAGATVGTANTTTLTIQWSMDAVTWSDGPAIVSASTADADSIVQVPVLGRYQRVYPDHTTTNAITTTVKAVCK